LERRSWNLKLDLDESGNVSVWIVERGSSLSTKDEFDIALSTPISMSSVLFEIEVTDQVLG
jgi:hypothetical protein